MPITQQRMLALLQVARQLDNALREHMSTVRRSQQLVILGDAKAETELALLASSADPSFALPQHYADIQALLAREEQHFKSHRRANERAQAKQKKRREARGIMPMEQSSAPRTLRLQPQQLRQLDESQQAPARSAQPQFQQGPLSHLTPAERRAIEVEALAGLEDETDEPAVDPFEGEPETEAFHITPTPAFSQDETSK